ncbi:MAG TPA: S9 family peptidase [Flavobacteriales bacterium]|nr:S9 family peptidase [Flavobacteriales bacterium]
MMHFRPITLGLLLSAASVQAQKDLTNQEIWFSPTFGVERVGGLNSMNDGLRYTALDDDGSGSAINIYDYRSGEKTSTLVSAKDLGGLPLEGYALSGDEQRVMLETAIEPQYRYSYYAHHFVYDLRTRTLRPLCDTTKSKQRLATFSPDGSRAAFVRDNDLYVTDLATMKETRITTDGEWNKVINGATDWVYEEEFTLVQGYQWNSTGTKLVYLRSDESDVKEFNVVLYRDQLYPTDYRFKYPKAGEKNSTVSLHVHDLTTGRTTGIQLGTKETDIYLPRFGFTQDPNTVWFMRMNRLQNEKLILTMNTDGTTTEPVLVYRETSPTYIEVTDDLYFAEDGSGFILTNETTGWNQIHWCPLIPKRTVDGTTFTRPITNGAYDVLSVKGIDRAGKRVIFTASMKDPMHSEVYAIGLNGKGLKELSPPGGSNDPEFSKGFKYFINVRSTANEPPVTTLHDGNGQLVKTLKDNAKLKSRLAEYQLPKIEFIKAKLDNGTEVNAWVLKPRNFDSRQQHPVFMTQYSGPNSNEVTDSWGGRDFLWHCLLTQKGYVVVCADGRGTGRRGRDFRHMTYGQLGKYEAEDQIAMGRWLGTQPWVDKSRIGIQGWSFGGYMSSLCITKGADVFKAAIAVAPVTNWRYYDSIYTERYMGLPKDHADGYDDNSPINHVEKLRGKYMLVHGLADDNVHFQNSAEMFSALVKANKKFEFLAYPDKNHGIYGGTTRMHLFESMTDFVVENL